jgi:hypothetical protein
MLKRQRTIHQCVNASDERCSHNQPNRENTNGKFPAQGHEQKKEGQIAVRSKSVRQLDDGLVTPTIDQLDFDSLLCPHLLLHFGPRSFRRLYSFVFRGKVVGTFVVNLRPLRARGGGSCPKDIVRNVPQ